MVPRVKTVVFVTALLLSHALVAIAVEPIAQHLSHTTAKDTISVITLLPDNNGDADTLTCSIEVLPTVGTLYELSANYISFATLPIEGTEITAVPHVITDTSHRVAYSAPTAFVAERFEYSVTDDEGAPLTSLINGIVDVVPSDRITLSDYFHQDESSWTIMTATSSAASWSGTSTGSLNHFIYKGQDSLVLNQNNNNRWYFEAPAKYSRNNARLYGGTVSFVMGHFEGDLTANTRSNPKSFITLECSTCGTSGYILAQVRCLFVLFVCLFACSSLFLGWLHDSVYRFVCQFSAVHFLTISFSHAFFQPRSLRFLWRSRLSIHSNQTEKYHIHRRCNKFFFHTG